LVRRQHTARGLRALKLFKAVRQSLAPAAQTSGGAVAHTTDEVLLEQTAKIEASLGTRFGLRVRLTIPLPTIVLLGLLFTAVAAFQARNDRAVFYVLATATVCVLAVGVITRFGNIPINNQILTWSADSPPAKWATIAQTWWRLQTARLILQTAALCLVSSAVLIRTK